MSSISVSNFILLIPEIFISLVAFIVLIVGLFSKPDEYNEKVLLFNKLFFVIVIALFLLLILVYSVGDLYVQTMSQLFYMSPSVYLSKLIFIIFFIILMLASKRYLLDLGIISFEYLTILLVFVLGNLLLLSSRDFLSFYLSVELITICTYLLLFLHRGNIASQQSALKYFLLSSLATGFMLYGISFIYGYTGFTSFISIKDYLAIHTSDNAILLLGLVLVFVGLAFKLSLVPFHMWTPDVYNGADKFVLLILSFMVKFSVFIVFVRILWEPFYYLREHWETLIIFLIVASAIVGYIVAIYQKSINLIIAYSSIANMSYVLLAVLLSDIYAFKAILIYFITYGIAVFGFLLSLMYIKRDNHTVKSLYDLQGLNKISPFFAFAITIFLLSMAGIPITAGFFGKLFVLSATFSAGYFWLGGLVLLLSVVIMHLYFRIIKVIYFDSNLDMNSDLVVLNLSFISKCILFLLLIANLLFIVILPMIKMLFDQVMVMI